MWKFSSVLGKSLYQIVGDAFRRLILIGAYVLDEFCTVANSMASLSILLRQILDNFRQHIYFH